VDQQLRNLERQAKAGDIQAQQRLQALKIRIGECEHPDAIKRYDRDGDIVCMHCDQTVVLGKNAGNSAGWATGLAKDAGNSAVKFVKILMVDEEWLQCTGCEQGWMGNLKNYTCDWCKYGPLCDVCLSIRNHSPCTEKFYP